MAEEDVREPESTDEGAVTVEVQPYGEKPGKPQLSDDEVEKMDQLPPDDEIGRYAKDAQKRIKSLHIANQEWRRRSVQAQREAATATNLAQQLYGENQQLKGDRQRNEHALIGQALQRSEAQMAQAKQRFLAARQAGDASQELAAQEEIARCAAEAHNLRLLQPAPAQSPQGAAPQNGAPPPQAAPTPPQAPMAPQPQPQQDEGTRRWLSKNPWYNRPGEEEMSGFALGVHQALEKQGIFANSHSKEYWDTIDKKLREKFPERFADSAKSANNGGRPVAVAGATRTNGAEPKRTGSRHVVLSESQVKLARSLGISNEQYAMQLVKDEQSEGQYHDIATK